MKEFKTWVGTIFYPIFLQERLHKDAYNIEVAYCPLFLKDRHGLWNAKKNGAFDITF